MTQISAHDLHYGHLGEAIYDPDSKRWIAKRVTSSSGVLQALGQVETYAASSIPQRLWTDSDRGDSNARRQAISWLLQSCPEICPAASFIPQLVRASERSLRSDTQNACLLGDLLAYGRAYSTGDGTFSKTIPLVATLRGESEDAICIMELRQARRGWGSDKSVWLETSEPNLSGAGWWQGQGGPVRQLCFAKSVDATYTLLAVRSQMNVTILRPVWRKEPTIGSRSVDGRPYPPSHIGTQLLIMLSAKHMSNDECADVVFNPWYQQQFATLNRQGHWAVWIIESQQPTQSNFKARAVCNGEVDEEDDEAHSPLPGVHRDGWGRIIWIGNVHTILVCNRRRLQAFDIRETSALYGMPELDIGGVTSCILDMRKSPFGDDDVFIVTSVSVIWLRFCHKVADGPESRLLPCFKIVISWKHCRDIRDTSMRISFQSKPEGNSILLYSRRTPLITEYQFWYHAATTETPVSMSDPRRLDLPSDAFQTYQNGRKAWQNISDIHVEPVVFGDKPYSTSAGPGRQYKSRGIQFHWAFVLTSDLGLSGCLYYSQPAPKEKSIPMDEMLTVSPPSWKNVRKPQNPRAKSILGNNFVGDDHDAIDSGVDHFVIRKRPRVRDSRSRSTSVPLIRTKSQDESWTVPNESLYDYVCDHAAEDDIIKVLDEVKQRLLEIGRMTALQTLASLVKNHLKVTNMDEISKAIEGFLDFAEADSSDSDIGLIVSPLASPTLMGLGSVGADNLTITSIYSYLHDHWILPLPRQLPNKTRLTIDYRVRQAAATLYLACIGLELRKQNKAPEEVSKIAASGARLAGVYTHATASRADTSRTSEPRSPAHLPIPSPPSWPTSSGIENSPSLSATMSTSIHPAATSLQKYITISRPPPIPGKTLAEIITHWAPGTNPAAYDYTATTAVLSGTTPITGSDMSAATQEKLKHRRERAAVREAQLTASRNKRLKLDPRLVGNQPNMVQREWASSQGMPGGDSSHATQPSQMQLGVASQIEPGRHGGRLVLRGKRKAGF